MKAASEFSFDEWAALAKADPAAFELRRRALIADFLRESGPRRRTGETLQREIDSIRAHSKSPTDALVTLTTMLSDQLAFLGEELSALKDDLGAVRRTSGRVQTFFAPHR
jgi:hypothetical protein